MHMQPNINDEENRFHTTDLKHAEYTKGTITKALSEKRITPDDVLLIREFVTEVAVSGNIKPCRKFKLTSILTHIREFIPEFRTCATDDVYRAIEAIREAK
ncbi:MAG: hypothetical protein WC626_09475 [Methanoregula sp.]